MTGIAELVIGGVALTSLVDTCINTFERIDAGRNCGRDYQEAAVKIVLLGKRFHRWQEAYSTCPPAGTPEEGYVAKNTMQSIQSSLGRLSKTTDRYQPPDGSQGIASATEKLQAMTISKVKTSLGAKIKWALHDKKEVNEVILSVRFKIDELISLTSSFAPSMTQVIAQRTRTEAEELVQPGSIEEPDDTIPALKAAAAEVDPQFNDAVSQATAGHKYGFMEAKGKGRAAYGDFYTSDYKGPISTARNEYKHVLTQDEATTLSGTMYGKSIFEM